MCIRDRAPANQPVAIGKMSFESLQQDMRAGDHVIRIELGTEHGDQPRRARAKREISGRNRQPALHGRGAAGILRQPVGPAELGREINQDRVGISDDDAVVVQHRHLAERIEGEEFRPLVRTRLEVNLDQLVRNSEQGDEQARAMRMARERKMIELHGAVPDVVGGLIPGRDLKVAHCNGYYNDLLQNYIIAIFATTAFVVANSPHTSTIT